MRTLLRFSVVGFAALALVAISGCDEYLGNINEGLNVHNLSGKILIPKTAAPTIDDIGVVYVGVWSGVDLQQGYLSPVTSPSTTPGVPGDSFPYGGTAVGDFFTRDARYVCQNVTDRDVKDAGSNWELDFEILQFPFYPGSAVWAFADQSSVTCNAGGGFYDPKAIYVAPSDVVEFDPPVYPNSFGGSLQRTIWDRSDWKISLASTDLSVFLPAPGSELADLNFVDATQHLYLVTTLDGPDKIGVRDFYRVGRPPAIEGFWEPQIQDPNTNIYYGTQYQDVLNHPTSYMVSGDLIPSTPTTIDNLSPVELTLDSVVP